MVSLAGGVSKMAAELRPSDDPTFLKCLRDIDYAVNHALAIIHTNSVSHRTIRDVAQTVSDFHRGIWGDKEKNAQTYVSFSMAQLEGAAAERIRMLPMTRRAISRIIEALSEFWVWLVENDREYNACTVAGVRAAERWGEMSRNA